MRSRRTSVRIIVFRGAQLYLLVSSTIPLNQPLAVIFMLADADQSLMASAVDLPHLKVTGKRVSMSHVSRECLSWDKLHVIPT